MIRTSARLADAAVACVDGDQRYVVGQGERLGDLVERVLRAALELVDRHDERDVLGLEVVERREGGVEPAVSTSTMAPIAPRTRSSHMNQKRFCPGVPNR